MADLLPKEFDNGFIVKAVKAARFDRDGNVGMTVQFANLPELGELPFLATANDTEEHGRWLFEQAKAGAFGCIADYDRPLPTVQDLQEELDKLMPDILLGLATEQEIEVARLIRIKIKEMTAT